MIIAGNAIPATRPIPTGAPIRVPSCHRIFFFLDHGFLPQKVQPDGLIIEKHFENQCPFTFKVFYTFMTLFERQLDVPKIMKIADFLHTQPTKFCTTNRTRHVIATSIVHFDNQNLASWTWLYVVSWTNNNYCVNATQRWPINWILLRKNTILTYYVENQFD